MDRINHSSAPNRRWVAKDPNIPNSGTVITKDWLQSIDDELINLIERAGIEPDSNDLEQIYEAVDEIAKQRTTLLGGGSSGSLANIFSGGILIDGARNITRRGDYTKVVVDDDFQGAGYLHLLLGVSQVNGATMPVIYIRGLDYLLNKDIEEKASGYLSYLYGVYHQNNTANGNNPIFYRSTTSVNDKKFYLRIKMRTAYFNLFRIDALDAANDNPFTNLTINSGVLTAKEFI